MSLRGVPGREEEQETGTKASSSRHILKSGRMYMILFSFLLTGIKE